MFDRQRRKERTMEKARTEQFLHCKMESIEKSEGEKATGYRFIILDRAGNRHEICVENDNMPKILSLLLYKRIQVAGLRCGEATIDVYPSGTKLVVDYSPEDGVHNMFYLTASDLRTALKKAGLFVEL